MGAEVLALFALLFGLVLALSQRFDGRDWSPAFAVLGVLFGQVIEICGKQIRAYQPSSVLDAKIANEKIKLWVSTLNLTAGSFLIAGVAVPVIATFADPQAGSLKLPTTNYASFGLIILGIYVHIRARRVFNYLKDESAPAETSSAKS